MQSNVVRSSTHGDVGTKDAVLFAMERICDKKHLLVAPKISVGRSFEARAFIWQERERT